MVNCSVVMGDVKVIHGKISGCGLGGFPVGNSFSTIMFTITDNSTKPIPSKSVHHQP